VIAMTIPDSPRARAGALLAVVEAHARPEAMQWLQRGVPAEGAELARGLFFGFYAGAGRRFSQPDATSTDAELQRLREAGIEAPEVWSLPDLVRGALLLAAVGVSPADEHVGIAREAFLKGDNAERVALLRTLPLLPEPERFVDIAVEACRTNVQDVFDAIACENPYPAAHFPELHFNQMIMKAMFTGVSLSRVLRWQSRNNAELRRMAGDFEAERRAAGRPVPEGVTQIQHDQQSQEDV
jgi:hypothetical protein